MSITGGMNVVGRLTNAVKPDVTLNSGTIQFVANNNPGVVSAESVGAVTLASGQSTINSGYAAAATIGAFGHRGDRGGQSRHHHDDGDAQLRGRGNRVDRRGRRRWL